MAGMQAMYPGGFGSPDMDINCRCTVRAEIEGMEPDLRRARDPETGKNIVIGNTTYEDWAKGKGIKTGLGSGSAGISGKSGKPLLIETIDFSNKQLVKSTLERYEQEIVNQDYESEIIVTASGDVYQIDGSSGRVHPETLGDKLKGAYVTHNHPADETAYSFSDDDLEFFKRYELQVLPGVDDKYVYELNRTGELDDLGDISLKEMTEDLFRHYIIHNEASLKGYGYKRWKNE